MVMTLADWKELLRTITNLGLTIATADRKTGVITIQVMPLPKK